MIWWDKSWNPVMGCSQISSGCLNCYACSLHTQRHIALHKGKKVPRCYHLPFHVVQCLEERLDIPLRRKIPTTWFVNSMSDLFHPDVPFEFVDMVYAIMRRSTKHTFLVLTKRMHRAAQYLKQNYGPHRYIGNVWLGVTVCNQAEADKNIPLLLQTPAAHRFLSIEPMLGEIDLKLIEGHTIKTVRLEDGKTPCYRNLDTGGRLDQVILGFETGKKARPGHPDWARKVRDDCKAAGVPFMFKQWGEWEVANKENARRNGYVVTESRQGFLTPYNKNKFRNINNDGSDYNNNPQPNSVAMARVGKKKAGRKLDGVEHNNLAWSLK